MVQFNIALILAFALFVVVADRRGGPGEKCGTPGPPWTPECDDDCYSCVGVPDRSRGRRRCMPVTSDCSTGSCSCDGDQCCSCCDAGTRKYSCGGNLLCNSISNVCISPISLDPPAQVAPFCYNTTLYSTACQAFAADDYNSTGTCADDEKETCTKTCAVADDYDSVYNWLCSGTCSGEQCCEVSGDVIYCY